MVTPGGRANHRRGPVVTVPVAEWRQRLEVTPDGIPHDEVAVAPHRSRRVAIEEDAAVAGVERSLDLDAAAVAQVAWAERRWWIRSGRPWEQRKPSMNGARWNSRNLHRNLGLETRRRQPLQMRAVRTRLAGSSGGKRRRFISMRSPPESVAAPPSPC